MSLAHSIFMPNQMPRPIRYKVARHSTIVLLEEGLGEDGKWAKVSYWGTEGYMLRKSIKEGWATVYDNDGMEGTEK